MSNYPTRGTGTITTICLICDKLFQHFKSNSRKYCSKVCQYKARKSYRHSYETRKKMSESALGTPCKNPFGSGKDNFNWKGGISTRDMKIRQNMNYRRWRKLVYKRDDYTCQECGVAGVELHAHHQIPFSESPLHQFDIDNGITLCKDCHNLVHSKGGN